MNLKTDCLTKYSNSYNSRHDYYNIYLTFTGEGLAISILSLGYTFSNPILIIKGKKEKKTLGRSYPKM